MHFMMSVERCAGCLQLLVPCTKIGWYWRQERGAQARSDTDARPGTSSDIEGSGHRLNLLRDPGGLPIGH